MPFSPDLGWREHTARAAHVSKCSLTSTVGAPSRDTGNTGNGATWTNTNVSQAPLAIAEVSLTSSPRLSGGLMTGLLAHCVWLSLVFSHTGVYCPELSSVSHSVCPWLSKWPYWTMSGRIGALNTVGKGWVDPLGVPSCEAMVTVGRVAILAAVVEFQLRWWCIGRLCSSLVVGGR